MVDFRGLQAPIVQAGMGAVARHELAAAEARIARSVPGGPKHRIAWSRTPLPAAWLGDDPRGPGWIRRINRLASPLVLRAPEGLQDRAQRARGP